MRKRAGHGRAQGTPRTHVDVGVGTLVGTVGQRARPATPPAAPPAARPAPRRRPAAPVRARARTPRRRRATPRASRRKRKPGKSIVNQKQTPWGLIAVTAVIVVFAAAIVGVVVATSGSKHKSTAAKAATSSTHGGQAVDANDPYRHPELAAAKAIPGVTYKVEGEHNHVDGVIKYDSSPPVGGNHDALLGRLRRQRVHAPDRQRERRPHARARRGVDHLQPEDAVEVGRRAAGEIRLGRRPHGDVALRRPEDERSRCRPGVTSCS